MIKAVIFDVGGVLIRTEDYNSRRNWERQLGLADWESEQIVFNSTMGQKAQEGAISDAELWAWVGERLSLGDQLDTFRAGFFGGDVLDNELVDFIRSLRPTYKTAIISNATDYLQTAVADIADAFDLIVGSAEEKVMKPAPEIYLRTLKRLGVEPQESVFIDDFAHNIAAAQALGMATIHYQPGTDVPAALAKLGIQPANDTHNEGV